MQELLAPLLGMQVHIEQHNDIGQNGRLVNLQTDYLSLYTTDRRLIHYPLRHIKSVTTNITELPVHEAVPDLVYPATFAELLAHLWLQPVRIELGAGQRQGVLVHVSNTTVSLVLSARELIHYAVDQIVNLSPVVDWVIPAVEADGGEPNGGTRTVQTETDQPGSSKSVNSQANGGDSPGAQTVAQQVSAKTSLAEASDPSGRSSQEPRIERKQDDAERSLESRLTLFPSHWERRLCRKGQVSGEKAVARTAGTWGYTARYRSWRDTAVGTRPWLPGTGRIH
ncbi:MAG: hypothetical protein K6T26_06990 [Alicyclobacillus sp.]|nr:hypothetical protein [Alicyclobacillus sp.]